MSDPIQEWNSAVYKMDLAIVIGFALFFLGASLW